MLHCRVQGRSLENVSGKFRRLLTFHALGLKIQRPGFAPEPLSGPINPNVHGLDFIPLRECHVLLLDSFTQSGAGGRGHLISYYNTPEDKNQSRGDEMQVWDRGALWSTCCVTGVGGAKKTHPQPPLFLLPERRRAENGVEDVKECTFPAFSPPLCTWKNKKEKPLPSACAWLMRLNLTRQTASSQRKTTLRGNKKNASLLYILLLQSWLQQLGNITSYASSL